MKLSAVPWEHSMSHMSGTIQDLEGAYQKVWEVDPLTCPRCGSEMRIISLIQDPDVIRRILEHLGLWRQDTGSRCKKPKPGYGSVVHEDFDDGWPGYEEPTITFY